MARNLFCIDNLPAGTYTVTETNPNGYLSTTPDSVTIAITLGSTQTVSFGDTLPPTPTSTPQVARLCTFAWFDQNANATRDGEPLLNNALLTIKDANGNIVGTRMTNGTEPYCVDNLPPGNYTVTENNPNGYTSTTPDLVIITMTAGSVQTVPFGDTLPPTSTPTRTPTNTPVAPGQVCTLVYWDQNANARRDGEPLLTGAVLTIRDANGNVVGTRTTNGTEPYCLSLPPGNYTVIETDPNGYTSTTPNQFSVTVTAGGNVSVEFGDNLLATPTPTRIPTPPPPIPIPVNEPKSMVSDPLRNRLYIASHLDGRVVVWDEIAQRALTTIPVGVKPVGIGLVNDRVFVGVNTNLWISVIDAATMTKMTDIRLNDSRAALQCDGAPMNLAVHPGLKRAYVALHGSGRVAVIDAVNNRLIECITTNSGTTGVAVDPSRNRLYVTNRDGKDLQVFDISAQPARLVQDLPLGGVPYFVAADSASGKVFVTVAFNPPDYDVVDNLYVFTSDGNALTQQTTKVIGNTHDGGHLWVSQANGMLYIAETTDSALQIYDPTTQTLGLSLAMPVPYGITENRGLGRMYIANRDINSISVVSDSLR